jgi:hypothetical protein
MTAGIDFGLIVAREVLGPAIAPEVQLMLEYARLHPSSAGSPKSAPTGVVQDVIGTREELNRDAGRSRSAQPHVLVWRFEVRVRRRRRAHNPPHPTARACRRPIVRKHSATGGYLLRAAAGSEACTTELAEAVGGRVE